VYLSITATFNARANLVRLHSVTLSGVHLCILSTTVLLNISLTCLPRSEALVSGRVRAGVAAGLSFASNNVQARDRLTFSLQ
jgi:hypothetical protein